MTIEKKIEVIQREIYWNFHVASQSKDKAQRERCLNRVESFRQDLTELKTKMKEIDLDIMSLEIICEDALELS